MLIHTHDERWESFKETDSSAHPKGQIYGVKTSIWLVLKLSCNRQKPCRLIG